MLGTKKGAKFSELRQAPGHLGLQDISEGTLLELLSSYLSRDSRTLQVGGQLGPGMWTPEIQLGGQDRS